MSVHYFNSCYSLSEELKASYQITDLYEYCTEEQTVQKMELNYKEVDYDRTVVLWDVVKVLALFRTNIKGTTELVGIGDYLVSQSTETYSNNKKTTHGLCGNAIESPCAYSDN